MRRVRALAALIAAVSVTQAFAAPFAVQVGDTKLALDTPPGFADVQATGSPRLLELAEQLTAASNKILIFALEDSDVRRFNVGDSPELRRYVIAVTPRELQTARVTLPAFHGLVADAMRELGTAPDPKVPLRTYLDAEPRRAKLLAELRKDQDVVSIIQGARLPDPPRSRTEPRYLLSSTTLMLVRGKALNLALYTLHNGPEDVEWLRAATLRWIEELQQLNLR
jgi:hypothetical protein